MDPIYTFFSENIETVTKEELLKALENALLSSRYWLEACLGKGFSIRTRSEKAVAE